MPRLRAILPILAMLPPSAAAGQHVATSEEYAVYRAALQTGGWSRVANWPEGRLVVPRRAVGFPVRFFSDLSAAELRDVDSTTLAAIRETGETEGTISADSLGLRGPYVEMSPATTIRCSPKT